MSIRAKIFIAMAIMVACGFFDMLHFLSKDLSTYFREAVEESLVDTTALLANMVAAESVSGTLDSRKLAAVLAGSLQLPVDANIHRIIKSKVCLLYTSPSPRDRQKSRMPSSA